MAHLHELPVHFRSRFGLVLGLHIFLLPLVSFRSRGDVSGDGWTFTRAFLFFSFLFFFGLTALPRNGQADADRQKDFYFRNKWGVSLVSQKERAGREVGYGMSPCTRRTFHGF